LIVYADSSFLVSNYVGDSHSAEADRRMSAQPSILLTPLNRAELAHAISQYVFRRQITSIDAQRIWAEFQTDCMQGLWVSADLPAGIWDSSIELARKYGPTLGIRTLDSLHIACALELQAQKFWTFDERQARLAEAVGLDTSS